MRFFRIYDLTADKFVCSNSSELWNSLAKAKGYIKRLRNPDGIHRYYHDMSDHLFYVFEYEKPEKGYLFVDNDVVPADIETVKTLYAKEI